MIYWLFCNTTGICTILCIYKFKDRLAHCSCLPASGWVSMSKIVAAVIGFSIKPFLVTILSPVFDLTETPTVSIIPTLCAQHRFHLTQPSFPVWTINPKIQKKKCNTSSFQHFVFFSLLSVKKKCVPSRVDLEMRHFCCDGWKNSIFVYLFSGCGPCWHWIDYVFLKFSC